MPITVQKYKKIWGKNAYDDIFLPTQLKSRVRPSVRVFIPRAANPNLSFTFEKNFTTFYRRFTMTDT